MGSKLYHVLFWLALMCTPHSTEDPDFEQQKDPDFEPHNNFERQKDPDFELHKNFERQKYKYQPARPAPPPRCKNIKPTPRDIVRRIYAILPYFDRDQQNAQFLQKYRATINEMSESHDMIDREAAFYAAVLTPIMFLQRYRDVRCLLERFEHALNEFQSFAPTEKKSALKHLLNLRDLTNKIRLFVSSQPVKMSPTRTPTPDVVNEDITDKKDVRFLKELIKNLG